jgi:hypothetical protein
MIQRIEGPEIIYSPADQLSYWIAAYNYIRFKYQRQDATFIAVTNVGGFARFDMSHLQIAPGIILQTGHTIYVGGQNYNTKCIITATQNITVGGNASFGYITNIPYNGNSSGYVNNLTLYPQWKMEAIVGIYDANDELKDVATAYYRALPNGDVWLDIQEFIKGYLHNNYAYDSNADNAIDSGGSVKFTMRTRVLLNPITNTDFVQEENYYAVNAALQAGVQNAPNMGAYVVFNQGTTARFASAFNEPTCWKGYPFSLSYLFYENANNLSAVKRWYDSNKTQVDATNNGAITDNPGKTCMLGIQPGVESSQPHEYIGMQMRGGIFPYPAIGEEKIIRVKTPCATTNEVMLVWRNQLGGWDYYLFEARHTQNLTVENGKLFKPWVEDLSSIQQSQKLLSKNATESISLAAASVDKNDADGIKSLLKSVAVYILQTEAPYATQRVYIEPGSWMMHDTKTQRSDIEFTITKPNEFLQHE